MTLPLLGISTETKRHVPPKPCKGQRGSAVGQQYGRRRPPLQGDIFRRCGAPQATKGNSPPTHGRIDCPAECMPVDRDSRLYNVCREYKPIDTKKKKKKKKKQK